MFSSWSRTVTHHTARVFWMENLKPSSRIPSPAITGAHKHTAHKHVNSRSAHTDHVNRSELMLAGNSIRDVRVGPPHHPQGPGLPGWGSAGDTWAPGPALCPHGGPGQVSAGQVANEKTRPSAPTSGKEIPQHSEGRRDRDMTTFRRLELSVPSLPLLPGVRTGEALDTERHADTRKGSLTTTPELGPRGPFALEMQTPSR